jgi:hypothetical protein
VTPFTAENKNKCLFAKVIDKVFVMPYTVPKQPNASKMITPARSAFTTQGEPDLCSAHFAFRSRLDLGKALTLLCLVFLACLLTTRSAHAQSDGQSPDQWTVQDQNDTTITRNSTGPTTNANGAFYLMGAPAAKGTYTYPTDLPTDYYLD